MKSIFSEYGSVILSALLGIVIITLFCGGNFDGNTGVAASLGALAQEQTDWSLEAAGEPMAFRSCMEFEMPVVSLQRELPLYAQTQIFVGECFALTPENEMAQLRVLSVMDEQGQSKTLRTEETTGREFLFFESPGLYEAHVELSLDGKQKEYRITIPVIQKEGME